MRKLIVPVLSVLVLGGLSAGPWPAVLGPLGPAPGLAAADTARAPTVGLEGIPPFRDSFRAPRTVSLGWTGNDPDGPSGHPTKMRYLFKRLPDCGSGGYLFGWPAWRDTLVSFADTAWSDWLRYDPRPDRRWVTFPDLPPLDGQGRPICYLFAVQAMDTAGVVTLARDLGRTVAIFSVSDGLAPALTWREPFLGTNAAPASLEYTFDIPADQDLAFTWSGTVDYIGRVAGYRWGWDLSDPDNPDDPGWSGPPGLGLECRRTPPRAFAEGTHTLTVECRDNADQFTRVLIRVNVIPVPEPATQRPLLLVDDVRDRSSNGWPDEGGRAHDRDGERDAFWQELLDPSLGGVVGFDQGTDVVDTEADLSFGLRDAVRYRSIVWAQRKASNSYVDANFDPSHGPEKFVWLSIYQQQIGNVFLCGQQSMFSFIGDEGMVNASTHDGRQLGQAPWMLPVVFDSAEDYFEYQGRIALGFGYRLLPDGTLEMIGPTRYPDRIAGIDALDAGSVSYYVCPGTPGYASAARKANCAGLKAVVLDPAFRTAWHDPSALADTIVTWRAVDWRDYRLPWPTYPDLRDPFAWGADEFYDTNVTSCARPIHPQTLPDGRPAIEPMWRWHSRYEWFRQGHVARGDTCWPAAMPDCTTPLYDPAQLATICGHYAFRPDGHSILEGVPTGFVSHRTEATKPRHRPDVYWGFDPSRFDRAPMKRAVRWVLQDVLGLTLAEPLSAP